MQLRNQEKQSLEGSRRMRRCDVWLLPSALCVTSLRTHCRRFNVFFKSICILEQL